MKTNIFKVKEKKEKKIIIEEEKNKNKLLIFFKRNKSLIMISAGLILICILLISVGLGFSLFGNTIDFDISYIDGDSTIIPETDPSIKDEDVAEELIGAGTEGIVLMTDRFMTDEGSIIMYFSDYTAIVIQADGKIYKFFSNGKEKYGVDRKGTYLDNSIKAKISAKSETLSDGSVVTTYSDGGSLVEYKNSFIYSRSYENVKKNDGSFYEIVPSGVSLQNTKFENDTSSAIKFSDGTYLVNDNNKKYIVNRNIGINIVDNIINYDKFNSFGVVGEKKLSDNNIITYYENGSAVISDKDGKLTYVNKSGDIIIKKNKIYEIISNDNGYSSHLRKSPNGTIITYYDNGSAVVSYKDGLKSYVEDSRNIIYGENGDILKIDEKVSNAISSGRMVTNELVTNFSNNKSEVINSDNNSYITDSSNIKLVENIENNENSEPDKDNNNEGDGKGGIRPPINTDGIYISDAENNYNETKSIESTVFVIRNKDNLIRNFRIVIEEVEDYNKFKTSRLEPKFVKFQALVGGNYVPAQNLDENTWINEEGKTTYVIYDGEVKAKSSVNVNLSLYVNYAPLDNSYQDKGFVGTIKVYLITEDEDDLENN